MITMNHIPLKIVRKVSAIWGALGFLLVTIGICIGTTIGLIVLAAGLVVLVGMIIFIVLFSRCPYCGGSLKLLFYNHYCPHCGEYVDGNA